MVQMILQSTKSTGFLMQVDKTDLGRKYLKFNCYLLLGDTLLSEEGILKDFVGILEEHFPEPEVFRPRDISLEKFIYINDEECQIWVCLDCGYEWEDEVF